VRPDYAAYLFVLVLLFCLAASRKRWKFTFALVAASGVLALSANLLLNKAITGHPLQAAYQVAIDRTWGPEPAHNIPGLGMLRSLLLPMGIPSWAIGSTAFRKYWLTMGPIAGLLLAQLALVPLLMKLPRRARYLQGLAIAILAFFSLSRMHDDLFGGAMDYGALHHSVPRYLTPVYLMAALPPLLFFGRCKSRALTLFGSVLVALLALGGCYEIWLEGSTLKFVHGFVTRKTVELAYLSRKLPSNAVVYTAKEDKWLWSQIKVWIVDDPNATAVSIERAAQAGLELYVYEPSRTAQFKQLVAELAKRHISLARADPPRGLYRVNAPPNANAP
jgi:hypothetical protein